MQSEDVFSSPLTTLLLTLRSITPSPAVDCNASSIVGFAGRGCGALLRLFEEFPSWQSQELLPPCKSGLSPPALRVVVPVKYWHPCSVGCHKHYVDLPC